MATKLDDNWLKSKINDRKVFFDQANDVYNAEHLPIVVYMSVSNSKKGDGYGKYVDDGDPCYLFEVNADKKKITCIKKDKLSLMPATSKYLEFTEEEKNFFKNSKVFKDLFLQLTDKMYADFPNYSEYNRLKDDSRGKEKVKELFDDAIRPENFNFKYYPEKN